MNPLKIIRTDCELETPVVDRTLREQGHELILLPGGAGEDALAREVPGADILLMCYEPITRGVIEAADRLRGIVKYGVGIDAIDIPAAVERGIVVVNVPEYAEETVAEGAFALMIALAKRLPEVGAEMGGSGWAWPEQRLMGRDIAGSTVGIVGMGRIGRSMARMAGAGFRAEVVAYDPHVAAEEMAAAGARRCESLDELLRESDFVTIHCVLDAGTRHLIGGRELKMMKPTAFLINVSRGAIVDEQALMEALDGGVIAGAGLDTFSQEPLELEGHPLSGLFGRPNVILSPHLTFYTEQAMRRLEAETLERCRELIGGGKVAIKSADPRLAGQGGRVEYLRADAAGQAPGDAPGKRKATEE